MNVLERIIQLDHWLFFKVNGVWTNSFLDALLPFLRESVIWIPFYLFLLVFILSNFGLKGMFWAMALICTASLCDIISSHFIKETIYRLRPCRDPEISQQVRLLVKHCGINSSFVSSHAVNHFGIATFIYATLRPYTSGWVNAAFVWAAVIVYAQVYVGVHYPLDVMCGALVGYAIGWVTSRLFNRYLGLTAPILKTDY